MSQPETILFPGDACRPGATMADAKRRADEADRLGEDRAAALNGDWKEESDGLLG